MSIKNTFYVIVGGITITLTKKQYESVLEQVDSTCSVEKKKEKHGAILKVEYTFIRKEKAFIILAHWENEI